MRIGIFQIKQQQKTTAFDNQILFFFTDQIFIIYIIYTYIEISLVQCATKYIQVYKYIRKSPWILQKIDDGSL